MNMQQVKIIVLCDFCHPRRQRQVIRRIFEQRITGNLHLVEADIPLRSDQPNRLRIGDEMDLVSTLRELQTELGSDDATAAVCRITRDADLHEGLSVSCECSTIG